MTTTDRPAGPPGPPPRVALGQIVTDCASASGLAGFWSRLLDRSLVDGATEFFAVVPAAPDGTFPALMFLQVPEPATAKNRLHLDLVVPDREAAVARAVDLGATRVADFDEWGTVWTTCADPEGNVFDVSDTPHG